MAKMMRCNHCGTSQSEVKNSSPSRGGVLQSRSSYPNPSSPSQANSVASGQLGIGQYQLNPRVQSHQSVPQSTPGGLRSRFRPVHALIIGAVIALVFLVFVDEIRLHSDVEVAGGKPNGQVIEIDLSRGFGVHQLTGQVNSAVDVEFTLDSGASDVALPEEVVKELVSRGVLERSDFIGEGEYVLANGDVVTAARFMLRSISIGDLKVSDVVCSTSPAGSPALLGQSFLRKFRSWNVDNTRNKLILQPPD